MFTPAVYSRHKRQDWRTRFPASTSGDVDVKDHKGPETLLWLFENPGDRLHTLVRVEVRFGQQQGIIKQAFILVVNCRGNVPSNDKGLPGVD